jgi:4-amino-4-deoxy-L-arabinose transferase-like glycosyltransferase
LSTGKRDDYDQRRVRRILIAALIVIGSAAIYLSALDKAPRYLAHDEVIYSLNGQSLAATGHDLNGRFMPMYIEYPPRFGRPTWDQPLLIYALAATLKALPVSEFAVRLPMAIAALVDVVLIYLIARLIFQSDALAAAAAALLAVTPAHVMHGRMATDFQLWVPFSLGWLWCLLLYLRGSRPYVLCLSGVLLGIGLYGYVAAYLFMPISAALTAAVLFQRRDPLSRYGLFILGIALPTVICLPWMLSSPLPFRDILAHYAIVEPQAGQPASMTGLDQNLWQRLAEVPAVYASFWDPQFLFINGPMRFRSTQLVGVFLLPVAGLIAVGLVRTVLRRSRDDLLVLAGFLTASLPASIAGEGQAIWRALPLAPFGVLLAVSGLQQLSDRRGSRAIRSAAVAIFAIAIGVGAAYHEILPNGQALVRASTVPVAVLGLAVLFDSRAVERVPIPQIAVVSAAVLLTMHAAYIVANHATGTAGALLAVVIGATLLTGTPAWLARRPLAGVALLALVAGHFLYVYVESVPLPRIGPVPASLVILAFRLIASAATVAATIAIARLSASRLDGLTDRQMIVVLTIWVASVQLGYYAIDSFTDYRLRFLHAVIVLFAAFGLALFVRAHATSRNIVGRITIVGLATVTAIHFASFFADYFTGFQVRNSVDQEGNARLAFERVIDRTVHRTVPAVYLGRIGPYPGGDLYWWFYLLKHHREDLLARTIPALDFPPDQIRALPNSSIVITSPTKEIDQAIGEMSRRGELQARELLKAPDGSPIFWILETRAR